MIVYLVDKHFLCARNKHIRVLLDIAIGLEWHGQKLRNKNPEMLPTHWHDASRRPLYSKPVKETIQMIATIIQMTMHFIEKKRACARNFGKQSALLIAIKLFSLPITLLNPCCFRKLDWFLVTACHQVGPGRGRIDFSGNFVTAAC